MHNNSSHPSKKIAVLIVAAGRGERAGTGLPKQYRTLGAQMVLTKTIAAFTDYSDITVVIHEGDKKLFEKAIQPLSKNIKYVVGGASRTRSVRAGLKSLKAINPKYVLIHDGARPFVSVVVINGVVNALKNFQAAVPSLPIVDALKTKNGNAYDRDSLVRVQTPQGFRFKDIITTFENLPDNANFADDIEVAKQAGFSIGFSKGDEKNIKLTYAQDFMHSTPMISITGNGYDVHQICGGKSLMLCGVKIDTGFTLKGHSDADVGLHALTDALLGAISAGDIGDHFPASDPKWKGASSDQFLAHAKNLIAEHGGILDHVDVCIICEQPKIKPHREKMRQTIANILTLPISRVSVKATTSEGLGFTGRGEGIAAQASASVRVPDEC
ncbi:MAG: bifunctional 2-C-methyl-D-erythritol 4-phosphate cytidylyltransferase/2-C-methyl-D-erythritol 2,4-cyclodiphosphate synthase [Robiginitomaculum sp.]